MFKTKPLLLTLAVSSILSNSAHADYTKIVTSGSSITGETVDTYQQIIRGTANDTTVTQYGYQSIESGGATNNTIINGGSGMVWFGGTSNNTVVNTVSDDLGNKYGSFAVNGVANNTILNGGSASINVGDNGTEDPYTGGKMNNTIVNNGASLGNRFGVDFETIVNSGGTLLTGTEEYGWHDTGVSEKATINDGGAQIVANGGTSKGSLINVGGILIVRNTQHPEKPTLGDAAGTAKDTTVYGEMQNNGAVDTGTIIKSGGSFTLIGTTAVKSVSTNALIENGGEAFIQQNAEASSWDIQGDVFLVSNNTSMSSSTVNGGNLSIYSGNASDTIMNDGEMSNLSGTDSNTVVNGGHYYLYDHGAISNNLTINTNGHADIRRGNLTDATINGVMSVANNATLNGDIKVNSSGKLTLLSGGNSLNASNTKMTVAGDVTLENQAYFNGGDTFVLNDLNMSGGNMIFTQGLGVNDYSTLEVGKLSGNGTFHMQIDMVGDGVISAGDKLVITGTSSGNHHISAQNRGSLATTGNEILTVVETADGGASFAMTNKLELGGYVYDVRKAANGQDWELYSAGQFTPPTPPTDPQDPPTSPAISATANASASFLNAGYLLNYAETQTLLQRMGDLRQSENSEGDVWARAYTGKFDSFGGGKLSGFDMDYTGVQTGVDKRLSVNGGDLYLGVMGGASQADPNYISGDGDLKGYHLGLYGTYVMDNDFYVDGVVKYNHLKNKFDNVKDTQGNLVDGDAASDGYGVSIEVGKRFYFNETKAGYYIEPQAQLSYNHQGSATTRSSNGLVTEMDSYNSTIGRVSALIGYEIKEGSNPVNVYVKTGYVTEMSGKTNYSLNGSKENHDFGGDWWENSIGVTAEINKAHNLYLEGTYSNGSKFNQTQVNVGYRYSF